MAIGDVAALSCGGAVTLCITSGCASIDYLGQSASGHLRLLAAARPVKDAMADPSTPDALRQRLSSPSACASSRSPNCTSPTTAATARYADLKRSAAVWNVVAAPELWLKLETWCFPIVGLCLLSRLLRPATGRNAGCRVLKPQGLEVDVGAVPAYSTLG